jgi:hypothetical protein
MMNQDAILAQIDRLTKDAGEARQQVADAVFEFEAAVNSLQTTLHAFRVATSHLQGAAQATFYLERDLETLKNRMDTGVRS